jgi:radical SAM superfamily enzyme YgiQ (UPF0313 family)
MKPDPPPYHALVLQPPPGDVTGPYPALCYLKAFAADQGYRVKVKDLGIEALHYLSHPQRVTGMRDRIRQQCARLEASPALDARQQRRYTMLLRAMPALDRPDWFTRRFGLFRRQDSFFDYARYKQARTALNTFFELLSALSFPTTLTPASYPTATMLKTMDAILAHRDPALNPYTDYYETELMPMIAADRPAVVGISMVFGNQSVQALALGKMIKSRFPDIHVTLGGAYLSQWVLNADDAQADQLLACTDSIICGEGEQAFAHLLERILTGAALAGLSNTIYRDERTRQLKRFERLNYTDLDIQPPPDFSDLDLDAYLVPRIIIPYCISRGCYWGRCVFCQNRYGDHRIRRYQTVPVEKAVAEMTALADRHGSRHFNFSNDVIDPAYLKALSQALLAGGRRFTWNTDLRAETQFDAQTCRLMADAGLNSVAIGFESGCQKTLDAMDKGNRVRRTARVMRHLYEAGVATQAMGIFGMPGESEADGEETVRFLEANADVLSYYVMGLLMVLPGSKMHGDPMAHGVTTIRYDHNPLHTPEPVWQSDTRMSLQSVNRLYGRLKHLENIFAIDEYPYVGGLCTNHGFFYYTLGPDILKRLRRKETRSLKRFYHGLGIDGSHPTTKQLKTLKPRMVLPHAIYPSRFELQRFARVAEESQAPRMPASATTQTYLIFPDHGQQSAVEVGSREIALLKRIDGQRTLQAVLKKQQGAERKQALSFVWYLYQCGAIEWI